MRINPVMKIEIVPVSFSDVDLFSEWEIGLGWDIESTQLSAGANEICFDHFAFPELLVGHFSSKQSMENLFALPDGMVMFLICQAKLPVFWCGRHLPPTLMGIVRSAREHWVVIPAGWDCYEFMVSEDLLRRTEIFPPDFLAETTQLDRAFLPLIEPITGQFLQRMDSFFHRQSRDPNRSLRIAVHRTQFFNFIIHGLLQVIDAGLRARGSHRPRSARHPDLVTKGRDFVSAHLTTDFSVDDMAHALGVSYRVLNYAFKDSLGISPYQYILTQKLHGVRRQLKSSEVSVTEACFSHGFYTPSRFARQYARLFGELPSETRYSDQMDVSSTEAQSLILS